MRVASLRVASLRVASRRVASLKMNILINKYKFCQYFLQRLSFKEQKMIQNMDWTGLDSWTGQLDWTIGLDFE